MEAIALIPPINNCWYNKIIIIIIDNDIGGNDDDNDDNNDNNRLFRCFLLIISYRFVDIRIKMMFWYQWLSYSDWFDEDHMDMTGNKLKN